MGLWKLVLQATIACVFISLQPIIGANNIPQIQFTDCVSSSSNANGIMECENALDGQKADCKSHHRLFHTAYPYKGEYWTGNFDGKYNVKRVTIYNRGEVKERLTNFKILSDSGEVCAEYNDRNQPFDSKTLDCNVVTTSLRVETRINEYLALCEVEAFGYRHSIDHNKVQQVPFESCTSSPTWNAAWVCEHSIDRVTGNCHAGLSTKQKTPGQFWEGQFGRQVNVKEVKLYNIANRINYNRLVNFRIVDDSGRVCAQYNKHNTFLQRTFKCETTTRSLKIISDHSDHLELCEVEVTGSYVGGRAPQVPFHHCGATTSYDAHWKCEKATNNKTNDCSVARAVYHSRHAKAGEFWEGFFDKPVDVTEVTVYNRGNTIAQRKLNYFKVMTDQGRVCGEYNDDKLFSVMTIKCQATTTSIRIQTEINKHLELCEVKAFGFPSTHIPKRAPQVHFERCGHSSHYGGYECVRAMDNEYTNCGAARGAFVASVRKRGQYWLGIFPQKTNVKEVRIYNRANTHTANNMGDFKIITDSGDVCAQHSEATSFIVKVFKCVATTRSLRIVTEKDSHVELCEVQAFGYPAKTDNFDKLDFVQCHASAVHGSYPCVRAMDKKKSQDDCSKSNFYYSNVAKAGTFWEGSFVEQMDVEKVRIYNRGNYLNLNRPNNFKIITESGEVCAEYNEASTFLVKTFKCKAKTNLIRIQVNSNQILELCEVEVLGRKGRPMHGNTPQVRIPNCKASSTLSAAWQCAKALDNRTHDCSNSGATFISRLSKAGENWEGLFNKPVHVKFVQIFNRENTLQQNLLRHFKILTDTGKVCAEYNERLTFFAKTFKCEGVTKSIRVQTETNTRMEICEVKVYGY